jgi:O-antigen/teichoic acid export membrane protein
MSRAWAALRGAWRAGDRRPLASSFAASAWIQACNAATGVILARTLGPHGRGELAAVMLWPGMLATVGSLGVIEATTYWCARAPSTVGAVLGTALAVCAVQATVLVAVGAVVVRFALAHDGPAAITSGHAFLAYIPLYLAAMYLMAAINGLHRYAWYQVLRALVIILSATGVVLLALAGRLTVASAVGIYLGAHLAAGIAAAFALRSELAAYRCDLGVARRLAAFGLRSHSGSVASLLNERLDQLLVSVFLPAASLGLYVVAVTLTSLTTLVGNSTALVALPAIARLTPGPARTAAAARLVAVTVLGSGAITIPLLCFTPAVIGVCFGAAFTAAVGPCRILLVAAVVLSVNRVLGAVLRAVGRPLDAGTAEGIALGGTALGLALLLRRLGLDGAAVTSLAAYLLSTAWMLRRVTSALGVPATALLRAAGDVLATVSHRRRVLVGSGDGIPGGGR